jgi:hypothetical protein
LGDVLSYPEDGGDMEHSTEQNYMKTKIDNFPLKVFFFVSALDRLCLLRVAYNAP